jgi:hypothetical protein
MDFEYFCAKLAQMLPVTCGNAHIMGAKARKALEINEECRAVPGGTARAFQRF